jgi:hypothetical protein
MLSLIKPNVGDPMESLYAAGLPRTVTMEVERWANEAIRVFWLVGSDGFRMEVGRLSDLDVVRASDIQVCPDLVVAAYQKRMSRLIE